MKFINKIFSTDDAAWKNWLLRDESPIDAMPTSPDGYLWRIISDELNSYRSITFVQVGNGSSTSFWFDQWLLDSPLCVHFPALFSHTTAPNKSVQQVFLDRFDLRLRPWLTSAGTDELQRLLSFLQAVSLSDGADTRLLRSTGRRFTSRDVYAALDTAGDSLDPHGRRIWATRVANKVKIFAWLFFKDRLSTKANLFAKHIMGDEQCFRCKQIPEDKQHLFFLCADSVQLWSTIQLDHLLMTDDNDLWDACLPPGLSKAVWPFVLLTTVWRIWDGRNGETFRGEKSKSRMVLSRVCVMIL
jgi:hypothetical protein